MEGRLGLLGGGAVGEELSKKGGVAELDLILWLWNWELGAEDSVDCGGDDCGYDVWIAWEDTC